MRAAKLAQPVLRPDQPGVAGRVASNSEGLSRQDETINNTEDLPHLPRKRKRLDIPTQETEVSRGQEPREAVNQEPMDMESRHFGPTKRKNPTWHDMREMKRSRRSSVVEMLQAMIRLIDMTSAF